MNQDFFRYIHQNSIKKMENLTALTKLHTINLSHNKIKIVEGLEGLTEIKTLDLSHNLITKTEDMEQLKQLPNMTNLYIQGNLINDHDNVLEFLSHF